MELTFIRHAESTANVSGHWQGQGDAPLSERGRQQARALADRLAGRRFDRIVASDLSRAADTARALGREVHLDPAWREVDVGDWEGLTREQVAEQFPEQIEALKRAEPIRIGGGESWLDLLERVQRALDRLRAELGPDERALVVTHGGVVHILLSTLMGLYERRPRPIGRVGNTAASTVRFEDALCELTVFNDASHLGHVGTWTAERLAAGDAAVALVGSEATAERMGVAVVERAGADVASALEATAQAYRGVRVGLLCQTEQVAAYAGALFGHDGSIPARVAPPAAEASCDVVVTPHGATFATYNLMV